MNSRPANSLRRRVAELLVVRASGHLSDQQRRYPQWELPNSELQRLLRDGVGGVILLGGSAVELQQRTQQLQGWSEQRLLVCADVEEGVGQRFEGASWLVPPLALGRLHQREPELALDLSERYGRCTGEQARRCGLNWVLGPVCDVNNNPANPVINVRAWGEDPNTASALAVAFQRGLKQAGVLGCAKHFPGHGDTTSDSHLDLPVLPHSRERLEQIELPPFQAAITAGRGERDDGPSGAAGIGSAAARHPLKSRADRSAAAPDGVQRVSGDRCPCDGSDQRTARRRRSSCAGL